ncbi:MAG TPA: hypothetical protein VF707_05455 [Ardenticatenaceae bacterium]|jgi:hypothetical protein
MNQWLETLAVGADLTGFVLTLWLGLYLLAHGWGWRHVRLHAAGTLWGLTLAFGLSLYDWLSPMAGASPTLTLLRLLLLPLPLGWFVLARRLVPGVVLAHSRMALLLVLLGTLGAAAVSVLTGLVVPEWLPRSWLYLPAYLLVLLLTMGAAIALALAARGVTSGALERRAMSVLVAGSWLVLVGGTLLATDLVLGLGNSLLPGAIERLAEPLRLVGSLSLLGASLALGVALRAQARAEGAHLAQFSQSLLATLVLVLVFAAVGGAVVWYWHLPAALLGLFLVLALLSDWLYSAAQVGLARLLHRGPAGKLRRELYEVAERLEPPEEVPPAVRPLLSRLARQVHSPQLGLALRDEKGFRVVAALRPSWEGAYIDVPHPDVWEERALSGWNKPIKSNGQTIGVIASETTGPLSPVQVRLLDQAATELVQLLDGWKEAARRREALQKALDDYRQHAGKLESQFAALAAPVAVGAGFSRGVQQVLANYKDAVAAGRHPLAQLRLVEMSAGPAGSKSIEGRGQVLQQTLASLIEQLRPFEGEPPTMPTPEWHPYLILKWVYLQGTPPEEVIVRLYLKKGTYDRAHRAAIRAVATTLAELEAGVLRTPARPELPGPAPTLGAARPPALSSSSSALSSGPSTPSSGPPSSTPLPQPASAGSTAPATPAPEKGRSLRDFTSRLRSPSAPPPPSGPPEPRPDPAQGTTRRVPAFGKSRLAARFADAANRIGSKDEPKATPPQEAKPPASPATSSTMPLPQTPSAPPATPPAQPSGEPLRSFTRPVPKPSEQEPQEPPPYDDERPPPDWDGT